MVDPRTARLWGYRALFAGLGATILFLRLLPLTAGPQVWPLPEGRFSGGWPGADLLLCLTLVWVQRRPDHLPAAAVAAVFLLEDILTMRPPGLWALLALLGIEFLRARQAITRDLPFWAEWAMVAALLAAMVLANRLILAVLLVPQAPLGQVLVHAIGTLALYPLVAVFVHYVLGLHRAAPGEVDSWGNRI